MLILVLPYSFAELTARIEALLRRGQAQAVVTTLEVAGLHMEPRGPHGSARWPAHRVTAARVRFLEHLMRHAGQVVTRAIRDGLIAQDEDSGTGFNSWIVAELAVGVYFARVRHCDPQGNGRRQHFRTSVIGGAPMTILKLLAWTCVSVALAACQPEPEPGTGDNICGTIRGLTCPDGQYCDLGVGQCQVADAQGACKPNPTACTREFKPVCGCDGKTYGNACEAASAGVSIDREGECEKPPG